jgi:hypothetical protein
MQRQTNIPHFLPSEVWQCIVATLEDHDDKGALRLTCKAMQDIMNSFLTTVCLKGCCASGSHFPSAVRMTDFSCECLQPDDSLIDKMSAWPQLQYLQLPVLQGVLKGAVDSCKEMHHVALRRGVELPACLQLLVSSPSLCSLEIDSSSWLPVISQLTGLRHLSLSNCCSVSLGDTAPCASSLTSLNSLHLKLCSPRIWHAFSHLTTLTSLMLTVAAETPPPGPRAMSLLSGSCHTLRHLVLPSTPAGLEAAPASPPSPWL